MNAEGRVAVVTGGGRGIGRGISLALAGLGFRLVVNYRADRVSADSACRDAETCGSPRAVPIQADVADLEQGRRLVDESITAHGRVDLWVNNAGIAPESRLDLLQTTPESWDRVLGTNLRGPFFLTQAVARSMIAHFQRYNIGGSDRFHHLRVKHVREYQPRRVLRGQGRPEHGRSTFCRWTGRAGHPGPRGAPRPDRNRNDTSGARGLHRANRGWIDSDPPMGNTGRCRPRCRRDRVRGVPIFHRHDFQRRWRTQSADPLS